MTSPRLRVAVVTGSRAEYGLLRPVIDALGCHQLEVQLIVSGMHLQPEFGATIHEIERDGLSIDARVMLDAGSDGHYPRARALGRGVVAFAGAFEQLRSEVVVVLGDRVEVFAAAIAAATCGIALAHIHGGDVTGAGLDESMRHAVTKLAHVHFPATALSAERVRRMGEQSWRIHLSGAPGMDAILGGRRMDMEEVEAAVGVPLRHPLVVLVQHPVSTRSKHSAAELQETLAALAALRHTTVVLYPNSDPGGRAMLDILTSFDDGQWLHLIPSLDHGVYISLLRAADVLVGNSSSGIVEAPALGLPVVNIGSRQVGRERAENVIDTRAERHEIAAAVKRALTPEFRGVAAGCATPYGDGRASQRIAAVLASLVIDESLLQKQLDY